MPVKRRRKRLRLSLRNWKRNSANSAKRSENYLVVGSTQNRERLVSMRRPPSLPLPARMDPPRLHLRHNRPNQLYRLSPQSLKIASEHHSIASRRIASHRIAPHRIASNHFHFIRIRNFLYLLCVCRLSSPCLALIIVVAGLSRPRCAISVCTCV